MKAFSTLAALALAAVALAVTAPAEAKNFTIGDPPVAVITLPDTWNPKEYDGGVEANAPDDGAYVAVEAVKVKDVESATVAALKYFKKAGIELDQSTMKQKEIKIGALPAIDVTWSGKDKDGPTNVSLTFVIMSDTQSVLLYLWGDDDDIKKAATDLQGIANSLRPVKG